MSRNNNYCYEHSPMNNKLLVYQLELGYEQTWDREADQTGQLWHHSSHISGGCNSVKSGGPISIPQHNP